MDGFQVLDSDVPQAGVRLGRCKSGLSRPEVHMRHLQDLFAAGLHGQQRRGDARANQSALQMQRPNFHTSSNMRGMAGAERILHGDAHLGGGVQRQRGLGEPHTAGCYGALPPQIAEANCRVRQPQGPSHKGSAAKHSVGSSRSWLSHAVQAGDPQLRVPGLKLLSEEATAPFQSAA